MFTHQVVTKKLHDEGRILVTLFTKSVELWIRLDIKILRLGREREGGWALTSNGFIKCLLSQVASLVRVGENLVVEHREVEG